MSKAAKPQEPVPVPPSKPSELDISMSAMSRERAEHLMAISERAGVLASELAVMRARLDAANAKIEAMAKEIEELKAEKTT